MVIKDVEVKLIQRSGYAAIVSFWDKEAGTLQARIVSISDVPQGLRVGQQTVIPEDVIETGTEYGIEWELLLDTSRTMSFLTEALRNHGVWTVKDLETMPQQVIAAIHASSGRIYAELLKLVKAM